MRRCSLRGRSSTLRTTHEGDGILSKRCGKMKKGVDEESPSVLYYDSRADEGSAEVKTSTKLETAQDVP